MLHRKSFTKWVAKFRSKGPVFSQWMLHRKRFTKWIAKFRSKGPVLSVDASPQKFHKMNCKISQQRSGLVSGRFTAKVSQNELQSFAAKVRSSVSGCFTAKVSQKWIAKFRSKGPVLSVEDASLQSFTKWIAKFRSKGPVLSVDASPTQQRSSNVSVEGDVYLVPEISGQKLFSAGLTAQAAFHKLS